MNVVGIIQARMASTRLPGKVMLPVGGAPLLQRMLERVRAAQSLDEIVVATTTAEADISIIELCRRLRTPVFAGHPTDLLERHCMAADSVGAEAVVKIPSDCPLIDPQIIDRVVGVYRANADQCDFVSNLHPASYPDGNDVEVISRVALEIARREAVATFEREHTTPFIWERPDRFRLINVAWEGSLDLSMSHRFTVDYPEDLAFVRAVFVTLHRQRGGPFPLGAILDLLATRPDILALNRHLAGVNWYRHHLNELRTIGHSETVSLEDRP